MSFALRGKRPCLLPCVAKGRVFCPSRQEAMSFALRGKRPCLLPYAARGHVFCPAWQKAVRQPRPVLTADRGCTQLDKSAWLLRGHCEVTT
jgi:hypothetical protein